MNHNFHKQRTSEKPCLQLCIALGIIFMATSCDFSMGGYKPLPEPPSGNATVSGTIQAIAPVAALKYTSADQTQADATGQLNIYPNLGLFLNGYNPPAYSFSPSTVPFHATGERTWETAFTASELALGTYALSEYYQPYADFGVAPSWVQNEVLQTFTVASTEPLTIEPVVYDMGGVEEGYSCAGRILIEGNPIGPVDLQLWMNYQDDGFNYYLHESDGTSPNWKFHVNTTQPGRLYYEIMDIGPDACTLSTYAYSSSGYSSMMHRYINGWPTQSGVIDLTEPQSMDLYLRTQAMFYTSDYNYNNANQGAIICSINMTGALDWESDILLVAEDVCGAAASTNSSCSRYLLPAGTGLNAVLTVELANLRAGTYSIEVYKLGEDNSVARERIGGLAEPYVLELPALVREEYNEVHYYQPQPYGEVEFDLEIPEGI